MRATETGAKRPRLEALRAEVERRRPGECLARERPGDGVGAQRCGQLDHRGEALVGGDGSIDLLAEAGGALRRGHGQHLLGRDRTPPDLVVQRRTAGSERSAAGEPGDDLGDERRGSLELDLAEEAEIGDPHRVPACGRLSLGLAIGGHHSPPGALAELRTGVAMGPFDRAPRRRLGAVEGRRRVRGEELELGAGAHPRSRSWSGS